MFIISKSESYKWPVKVLLPVDGGRTERQDFDAVFKRLSQTRINEIIAGASEGTLKDADVCREVMIGWAGVVDDQKQEIPFSVSALEGLLDIQRVASSIVGAFIESISGAKTKN